MAYRAQSHTPEWPTAKATMKMGVLLYSLLPYDQKPTHIIVRPSRAPEQRSREESLFCAID